jgi:ArsR family transcriptional regulator, arsenate/arsenite/antimonite-responsive transcriptional repressor
MRILMQVLKAVADRNRMRILKMLEQKKMCVCELAAVLDIKQPSVSKHLSILKNAGLIQDERNGQWIDYSLCRDEHNAYCPELREMFTHWLNDDSIVQSDRQTMKTLCREDICRKK